MGICGVCNEEFSQEYKDDEIGYLGYINFENKTPFESPENEDNSDQWHLINAIRPNGPKGKAYHSQYYKDKQNKSVKCFKLKNQNLSTFQVQTRPFRLFISFLGCDSL